MYKYPLPPECVCTYISILYSFNSWLSYIHVLMRDEKDITSHSIHLMNRLTINLYVVTQFLYNYCEYIAGYWRCREYCGG